MEDIKNISTKDLVEELMQRMGVNVKIVEPYEDADIVVNGPATVLTIID